MTVHARVSPVQNKGGFLPVIKDPERPTIRVVATAAAFVEASFVDVVIRMTLPAGERRSDVRRGHVALLARSCCVNADQWKPNDIVIEKHAPHPGLFVVTSFTPLSEFSLVGIVVFVTDTAASRNLPSPQVRQMTLLTL
jgi:hypothetical protein